MARVFKPTYPKPLPADAKIVQHNGRPHARFLDRRRGKTMLAPLTEDGQRILLETRKWYIEYRNADGVQKVPGFTDRKATDQLAAELEHRAARQTVGMVDPFEEHRKRPLLDHIAEYSRELAARDNAPRYVKLVISRLTALVEGCGFRFTSDLSASQATDWLAGLRLKGKPRLILPPGREWFTPREAARLLGVKTASVGTAVRRNRLPAEGNGKARRFPRQTIEALQDRLSGGLSVQTTNDYLSALKSFGRWMVKDRRMADNPFAHLEGGNARVDRRHDRRELEVDELRRVLAAARDSDRSYRGLTGPDRYTLYATACGTGFRASALASLTLESFDLTTNQPVVILPARHAKNRRTKVQPISPDLADLLRDYLSDKPAGQPVWMGTGTWAKDRKGAEMLRIDLEAAGIPYAVEGPDGPLYADFHALRHTYLTLGGRAGIDLRTLQELAGHSTPTLTARYSHRRLYDLQGAVGKMPSFLPDPSKSDGQEPVALPATGTDGGPVEGKHVVQHVGLSDMLPHSAASGRTSEVEKSGKVDCRKSQENKPVGTCQHQPASVCIRAGDGARTHDSHVGNLEPSILKLHSGNDLHPETPSACCPACRTPAEDADLGRIVEAWPNLPPAIKAGIMALVQASALAGNIWARSEDHEWESSR